MILELITETQQKIEQQRRLEQLQNELKNTESVRAELQKLAIATATLIDAVHACQAYINPEAMAQIVERAREIAQTVEKSRTNFLQGTRQQRLPLQEVTKRLTELQGQARKYWESAVNRQLAPFLELLSLVSALPEIAAQEAEIRNLVSGIRSLTGTLPKDGIVGQLERLIAHLRQRLAQVEQLPDDVRAFLNKVVSGTATLADLTPGVQHWMADANHAQSFRVTFLSRRSQ